MKIPCISLGMMSQLFMHSCSRIGSIASILIFNNLMVIVRIKSRNTNIHETYLFRIGGHEDTMVWICVRRFIIVNYSKVFKEPKKKKNSSPFHGAMGIVTCRVLLHLRKFTNPTTYGSNATKPTESLDFVHYEDGCDRSAIRSGILDSLTPKTIDSSLQSTVREGDTVSVRGFSLFLSAWSVIGLGYINTNKIQSRLTMIAIYPGYSIL